MKHTVTFHCTWLHQYIHVWRMSDDVFLFVPEFCLKRQRTTFLLLLLPSTGYSFSLAALTQVGFFRRLSFTSPRINTERTMFSSSYLLQAVIFGGQLLWHLEMVKPKKATMSYTSYNKWLCNCFKPPGTIGLYCLCLHEESKESADEYVVQTLFPKA